MKKIAKISLAAAVAVAGLTTANAQPLEQAIKGVETSGSVVYRYNDYNSDVNDSYQLDKKTGGAVNGIDGTNATQSNNYKAAINLAAPVNDFVKVNTRFVVASATNDFASLETSNGGDGNVDVALSNAYFGYTGIKNTTVNVGKQGLTTPWTVAVDSAGNEQTGTGALALTTLGNVTLAAAYFNQTNLATSGNGLPGLIAGKKPVEVDTTNFKTTSSDKDKQTALVNLKAKYDALNTAYAKNLSDWEKATAAESDRIGGADIGTVGTIVAVGPVTLDAWYADMQDLFSTYTIGAKSSTEIAGVKLGADARFVSLELDRDVAEELMGSNTYNVQDDNSLAKLTVTAKAGIFDAKAAYGKTGKEGGLTALDNDAVTTMQGWSVNTNGKADADFFQLVAGVDILPELNLSANYVNVDYTSKYSRYVNATEDLAIDSKTSREEEEIYAQLLYKMSKNLTSYVRYGVYSQDTSTHDYKNHTSDAKHGDSRKDTIDDTRGRIQVAYTF